MKSLKINIDKKLYEFSVPETFNELSQEQLVKVVELLSAYNRDNDYNEKQLNVLLALLGFYDTSKRGKKKIYILFEKLAENNELTTLFPLLDFVFEENKLTRFVITSLKVKSGMLCGPADLFDSMTFGEFITADMLCTAYFQNKSVSVLNKLVAVLFRKKGVALGAGDLNGRTAEISELAESLKTAVLYNYIAIRNWITSKYPLTFGPGETSKRTNIALGRKENSWLSVRRHLAGNVFNLEKVDKINIHEVLGQLESELKKM